MALQISPFLVRNQPLNPTPGPQKPVWGPVDVSEQLQKGIAGIGQAFSKQYGESYNRAWYDKTGKYLEQAAQAGGLGQPGGPYAPGATPGGPASPQTTYDANKPLSADIEAQIKQASQQSGLPEDYYRRIIGVESSGNPTIKNPGSGAMGLFQFIPSTGKQYGVTAENLGDIGNQFRAFNQFTLANKAELAAALGRDPTPGELGLAHQQGVGGAIKLLRADPNAPVAGVLGKNATSNLGTLGRDATVGQFANYWANRYGGVGIGAAPAPATVATGNAPAGQPRPVAYAAPGAAAVTASGRQAPQPSPEAVAAQPDRFWNPQTGRLEFQPPTTATPPKPIVPAPIVPAPAGTAQGPQGRVQVASNDPGFVPTAPAARAQAALALGQKPPAAAAPGPVPPPAPRDAPTIAGAEGVNPQLLRVYQRAQEIAPGAFALSGDTKQIRDEATQRDYVNRGWSKTMNSKHLPGNALDVVPINPQTGKPDANYKEGYAAINAAMNQAAKEQGISGLEWGGNWKNFVDRPHWQLAGSNYDVRASGGAVPGGGPAGAVGGPAGGGAPSPAAGGVPTMQQIEAALAQAPEPIRQAFTALASRVPGGLQGMVQRLGGMVQGAQGGQGGQAGPGGGIGGLLGGVAKAAGGMLGGGGGGQPAGAPGGVPPGAPNTPGNPVPSQTNAGQPLFQPAPLGGGGGAPGAPPAGPVAPPVPLPTPAAAAEPLPAPTPQPEPAPPPVVPPRRDGGVQVASADPNFMPQQVAEAAVAPPPPQQRADLRIEPRPQGEGAVVSTEPIAPVITPPDAKPPPSVRTQSAPGQRNAAIPVPAPAVPTPAPAPAPAPTPAPAPAAAPQPQGPAAGAVPQPVLQAASRLGISPEGLSAMSPNMLMAMAAAARTGDAGMVSAIAQAANVYGAGASKNVQTVTGPDGTIYERAPNGQWTPVIGGASGGGEVIVNPGDKEQRARLNIRPDDNRSYSVKTDKNGRVTDVSPINPEPAKDDKTFLQTTHLSDRLQQNPEFKKYQGGAQALAGLRETFSQGNASADVAAIYAMAKVMDPTSTVGAGDQVLFSSTSGVPGYVQKMFNKAIGEGGNITAETRADLYNAVRAYVVGSEKSARAAVDETRRQAQGFKLDPDQVIKWNPEKFDPVKRDAFPDKDPDTGQPLVRSGPQPRGPQPRGPEPRPEGPQAPAAGRPGSAENPVKVTSSDEGDALPAGWRYIDSKTGRTGTSDGSKAGR